MSLASATKQQLRSYKLAASTTDKRATENVSLEIKMVDGEYVATLVATDGFLVIRRGISAEISARTVQMNIPRAVLQSVERTMNKADRAYFDNGKITIRSEKEGQFIAEADSPIKATMPFTEQTELKFPDVEPLLVRSAKSPFPIEAVKVDGKLLKELLDQFKDSFGRCTEIEIHVGSKREVLLLKARDIENDNEITGGIMPLGG